jgi:hypothetical protein
MRLYRSLIALVAAYAILFAAVFGALASGRSAAFSPIRFCNASALGEPVPLAPAHHDRDCCLACYASNAGGSPSPPQIRAGIDLSHRIAWPARAEDFVRMAAAGAPARAPPSRA